MTEDHDDRMTAGAMLDYELLAQDAMRGIVRAVLTQTAKSGLPGDHHFYISFDTHAAGVSMSRRLREKYPHEMTIVLQHRFWDLAVTDERFEVKLTFDGIPERLVVPFAAIKVFFDPSVRYGLQFEEPTDIAPDAGDQPLAAGASGEEGAVTRRTSGRTAPAATRKPRAPRKPRAEKDSGASPGSERAETATPAPAASPSAPRTKPTAAERAAVASAEEKVLTEAAPAETSAEGGAKVVSLDAFRKK